jgi:uncharacterized protein YidB (DUF937 family)
MDMQKLLEIAAGSFMNSNASGTAGSNLDMQRLVPTLSGLLGGDNTGSGVDLGGLLARLNSGGLSAAVSSWLGDGANQGISPAQVTALFGPDKVADFASQLGLSHEEAAGGLADALPQMVDKASSGGSLLDAVGGVSGALNLAGKLFGR